MVHCMWRGNMAAVVRMATSERLDPSRTDLSAGHSRENSWEITISEAKLKPKVLSDLEPAEESVTPAAHHAPQLLLALPV